MDERPEQQADEPLLRTADKYTQAPKVSHKVLTKEERLAIIEANEKKRQEAAKLEQHKAFGPVGRWWRTLQSGPDKVTLAMSIVALGVVYGDIGTSPLYTMQTFLAGQGGVQHADETAVIGMLSLVFWTMTLITTVEYVLICMRVDNKGEGGIFALYSLLRKYGKWLIVPAMIGGAAFLADSVLTPAMSISSAVEGLQTLPALQGVFEENPSLTLFIALVIILAVFAVQSRGTERIGKVFGSTVLVWFLFIAVTGAISMSQNLEVLRALNPVHGIQFLVSGDNHAGLALMGTVFLSITGAEALYSDMGHVGRGNIYATWPFINLALVLSYFGQGAWIIRTLENPAFVPDGNAPNPFFAMLTPGVRYVAVLLSVIAGIIASQALISGAFTIVSEATRLNWMPHLQVRYPARTRGQLYIPTVNVVLCCSTLLVLLIFRNSEHIAAAYGLALTITMIMTSILVTVYLWHMRSRFAAVLFAIVFPHDHVHVLHRVDGQVPARRLVHDAARARDPHRHGHVGRGHEARARATSPHEPRGLPAGAASPARRRHDSVLCRQHRVFDLRHRDEAHRHRHLLLDLREPPRSARTLGGAFRWRPRTSRSRANTRWRRSARTSCSACAFGWDSRCARRSPALSAPDYARSAAHRRTSAQKSTVPEGGCRSGDRPDSLRAHSQGAHARVEGVAKGCDGPAHQVCDPPCRRLAHQMVRLGPV